MAPRNDASSAVAKEMEVFAQDSDEKLLAESGQSPHLTESTESDGLHDKVAARAYALYGERGYRQCCDLQDWLDAEREILSQQPPV